MDYPHTPERADVIKFAREAADVRRCHTIRTHSDYTVGHHSFNMLAILRIIWPKAPVELLWAIVEHDLPERLSGDIPAPTKWAGIVDRDALVDFEGRLLRNMLGHHYEGGLTAELLAWLRGLDILELYLFCKDQIKLGNSNFAVMHARIERYIERSKANFAPQIVDLYYELKSSPWDWLPDLGD